MKKEKTLVIKFLSTILLVLTLSTSSFAQQLLSFGTVGFGLISNAGGAGTTSTAFALPTNPASVLTWTTSFSSAPASVTITLQGSLDNVAWFTLDTSTNVNGELRTVMTSVRFIRAVITAKSGGGNTTVSFQVRAMPTSNASLFAGGTVTGVTNFVSTVTFNVPTKFSDGTAAAPSITFASDTDTGWYQGVAGNEIIAAVGGVRGFGVYRTAGVNYVYTDGVLSVGSALDVLLTRDAPNTLAQRNGINPQKFRLYNTYTNESTHLGWEWDTATANNLLLRYRNNGVLSTVGTFTSGGAFTAQGAITANTFVVATTDSIAGVTGRFGFGGTGGRSYIASTIDGNIRVTNNDASNTYDITLADWGTTQSAEALSVANDGLVFLGAAPFGVLVTTLGTDQQTSQFQLSGSGNNTVKISDPGSMFTITKDTANTINIYYDASGGSGAGYYLQNKRGGTRTLRLVLIGA